jgi:hypothetical protein
MKRGLLIGGALVVVVIVGIVAFLVLNINPIVKEGVQTFGSDITKVSVKLNEVDISPWSGKGKLAGLTVGNPQGFKTDSAFSLGLVSVNLDAWSVTGDTVVIHEVVIAGPQVTYELGPGGSNIQVIQKNVEDFIGTGDKSGGASGKPSGEAKSEGGGKKIIIENLIIRDGNVSVSAALLQGKKLSVPLPSIHLKDIGKDEGGASPGQVAQEIMDSVTEGATKAVASLNVDGLIKDASGMVKDAAKGATDAMKDIGKNLPTEGMGKALGEGAGEASGAVEKGAEEAGKALKKLFGN